MDPDVSYNPIVSDADTGHALVVFDPVSLLVGVGLAFLPLCLVLLMLARWAWNRLRRFKKISLERIDGQPLWIQLSIDETPKPSLWDRMKELNK